MLHLFWTMTRPSGLLCFILVLVILMSTSGRGEGGALLLKGRDFKGGGNRQFGATKNGQFGVNYVYAGPTGDAAKMTAEFDLPSTPTVPLFLHLLARDDDFATTCPIEIRLNDRVLFSGPDGFPGDDWAWRTFAIPEGVLRAGKNSIIIRNIAPEGKLGMPPWFMLARCVIGGETMVSTPESQLLNDFFVTLPAEKRPLPEPLPAGQQPGFPLRGTKGWAWTPEQYLAEIPTLVQYKMNFLMSCYTSWFDLKHMKWSDPGANRWWEPLPEETKHGYERVVRECQKNGVEFCFAMNPNFNVQRVFRYDNEEDYAALWPHYAWMAGLGVNWFCVSLDDITHGIDPEGQSRTVNRLLKQIREVNPQAKMIFCPTIYWGKGDDPKEHDYLEKVARTLDPDVYCFWTGDMGFNDITREGAEKFKAIIGHRLFLWDNYPVNDDGPTMHLGPMIRRDHDLYKVIDGYMSNPHCPQNQINRLPLLTCADYAWNPEAYDPARSIGQAILHLAETDAQRRVLKDLVELYPGRLLVRGSTHWNPVRERFDQILGTPHSRYVAEIYLNHARDVAARLAAAFPDRFADAGQTLKDDIESMQKQYADQYGEPFAAR